MDGRLVLIVCLLFVFSMVVPTASVVARKPPEPPGKPPGGASDAPGTVFFTYQGWMCTINGDVSFSELS